MIPSSLSKEYEVKYIQNDPPQAPPLLIPLLLSQ